MKLNLTLSYCTFLTFFLLLKVEGTANAVSHPVTYKITHIKTLFEKLKPLDEKIQKQIDAVLKMDDQQDEDESEMAPPEADEEMEEEDMISEEQNLKQEVDDAYLSEEDDDLLEGFDQEGMEEEFTKEQLKELQQVIKMNINKNKKEDNQDEIVTKEMTKKLKKSLKKKMAKLDDFEDINQMIDEQEELPAAKKSKKNKVV